MSDCFEVAIRADASARIGGGHVMRCLTLADELRRRGGNVVFVSASLPHELAERIRGHGHAHVAIDRSVNDEDSQWDRSSWPDDVQQRDARAFVAATAARRPRWIVVDHYRLDARWEAAAASAAPRILAIDDLANRPHLCDLLLDTTIGRSAVDYRPLVSSTCDVLAGAEFALLRPEFATARPLSLSRRAREQPARIIISLGMTDVDGLTAAALAAAMDAGAVREIDVVFGTSDAPSLPRVRAAMERRHGVDVHVNVDGARMADLMSRADLAIGAAGTTSWERCCLGLPTISLVLAGNQRLIADRLDEAGAAVVAAGGDGSALSRQIEQLLGDRRRLLAMSEAAAAITDGEGAPRLATRLLMPPD